MKEYLATLDDAAFGAATDVAPKFVSPSDPAAQWTGAMRGPAFFAYADNYLIDVKCGIIMDVEASRAVRQAEVGAAKTMIDRTEDRFGLRPERLAGDTAYGSAEMLNWLVEERQIAPHIPVIDKSARHDGTFAREDFRYNHDSDTYTCPAGKTLTERNAGERRSDAALPRKHPGLRLLPVQRAMLSQHTGSQDPAQPVRRRPRSCPIPRRHRRLRAIAP